MLLYLQVHAGTPSTTQTNEYRKSVPRGTHSVSSPVKCAVRCGRRADALETRPVFACLPAVARWRAGRALGAQAPCASGAGDRDFLTRNLNHFGAHLRSRALWPLVHHLAAVDLYEERRPGRALPAPARSLAGLLLPQAGATPPALRVALASTLPPLVNKDSHMAHKNAQVAVTKGHNELQLRKQSPRAPRGRW